MLALVLLACGPKRPPLYPRDARAFAAAEAGWRAAGLPEPGNCLAGARVAHARDYGEFADRCQLKCDTAAACLVRYIVYGPIGQVRNKRGWLALIEPGRAIENNGQPIVHEAMHALIKCHLRRSIVDPFDAGHTDPRVWGVDGANHLGQDAFRERAPPIARFNP